VTADWHPTIDQIADDEAGLTSTDDRRAIAEHLAACSTCRETAEQLAEVSTLLAEAGATAEPMPAGVADALDQALATAAAERASGVPSLDEHRTQREKRGEGGGGEASGSSGSGGAGGGTSGSGRRGRRLFGAAAAVAVFAIGAAVTSNGLPGSSNNDDSAASSTAESDAGAGAAGDAAGGKAETTPEAATDGALRASKPELNADNVDAYAKDLAEGKAKATAPRGATCGNPAAEPSDSALPSAVSSVVSYDGERALLRVDPDSRRLIVLSCPGPTRVLYTSTY
jgi:hypothetical protein